MLTIEDIVNGHPFFTDMKKEHVEDLITCAGYARYEEGETIFQEGEQANYFYLIGRGRVSLDIHVPHRGIVPVLTIDEGDVLGWSWLFPPYLWQFSARALDQTQAVAFNGRCLREKCQQDHELGYELMKRFASVMTQRLQAARMQLLDVYSLK